MDIAICHPNVFPTTGGCATYIADLARRLVRDGHEVHLYAGDWDAQALPNGLRCHRLSLPRGPRFLRPWAFGAACIQALKRANHDVSIGFDKTLGTDIVYPQGGLHAASFEHNLRKHRTPFVRWAASIIKSLDLAHWSFARLEQQQYLGPNRPVVIAISDMVRRHFQMYYGIDPEELRLVHAAIDPARFRDHDRARRRHDWRRQCGIAPDETVALFVGVNYALKGLDPLLRALPRVPRQQPLRLLVVGHANHGRYRRLARRLGVEQRVCFAGPVRDVKQCYFAADFLVHPTFYDPCSLVALEALACGLPVITSRYNGATELFGPRDGYVVDDPHDHERLAWCITQLLDPIRRQSCAASANLAAARWTFERHYRQILPIFEEVASQQPSSRTGSHGWLVRAAS